MANTVPEGGGGSTDPEFEEQLTSKADEFQTAYWTAVGGPFYTNGKPILQFSVDPVKPYDEYWGTPDGGHKPERYSFKLSEANELWNKAGLHEKLAEFQNTVSPYLADLLVPEPDTNGRVAAGVTSLQKAASAMPGGGDIPDSDSKGNTKAPEVSAGYQFQDAGRFASNGRGKVGNDLQRHVQRLSFSVGLQQSALQTLIIVAAGYRRLHQMIHGDLVGLLQEGIDALEGIGSGSSKNAFGDDLIGAAVSTVIEEVINPTARGFMQTKFWPTAATFAAEKVDETWKKQREEVEQNQIDADNIVKDVRDGIGSISNQVKQNRQYLVSLLEGTRNALTQTVMYDGTPAAHRGAKLELPKVAGTYDVLDDFTPSPN